MCEDEMNGAAKNLSAAVEPVLMVFAGLLVGFVATAIITPIYGITQLLQK
jgi:type II secretory pathway component PulF